PGRDRLRDLAAIELAFGDELEAERPAPPCRQIGGVEADLVFTGLLGTLRELCLRNVVMPEPGEIAQQSRGPGPILHSVQVAGATRDDLLGKLVHLLLELLCPLVV